MNLNSFSRLALSAVFCSPSLVMAQSSESKPSRTASQIKPLNIAEPNGGLQLLPGSTQDPLDSEAKRTAPNGKRSLASLKLNPVDESMSELVRQRYANGAVSVERSVAEDKHGNLVSHGHYVQFSPKGEVVLSGNYYMGTREDEWTRQLVSEEAKRLHGGDIRGFAEPFTSTANFRNDRLHGIWTVTDSRGKMLLSWEFKEGKRHGKSMLLDSKGQVVQSLTYKENLVDGPGVVLNKTRLVSQTTTTTNKSDATEGNELEFYNGRLLRRVDEYYPVAVGPGNARRMKAQETVLAPSDLNVLSTDWLNSRVDYQKPSAIAPLRHGRCVTLYANGLRASEGHYDHGKRVGAFAWWYPNGQQQTVGEYRDDREHGEWEWWHENGMKQSAGVYQNGAQVADWSVWADDGKLVRRDRFNPGRAQDGEKPNERVAEGVLPSPANSRNR